jgi:hypothetical protein
MTQKDVSLYYNLKVYIKKFPQKCHFQISLSILTNILSIEKCCLHYFKSVFEHSMLIRMISNFAKYYHKI